MCSCLNSAVGNMSCQINGAFLLPSCLSPPPPSLFVPHLLIFSSLVLAPFFPLLSSTQIDHKKASGEPALPTLSYLDYPNNTLPNLISLYLTSPHLTLSYLNLCSQSLPYIASPYLTFTYLTLHSQTLPSQERRFPSVGTVGALSRC